MICSVAESLASGAPTQLIDCNVESLSLSADTAITLGLIVNELVTNAIKYASGVNGGKIFITGKLNNGGYVVTVRDEGPGFPENFDSKPAGLASLGMRLIHSLALKINARIEFSPPRTGGSVTIHMPLLMKSDPLRE
jgi:two-component sensor histidine kinase